MGFHTTMMSVAGVFGSKLLKREAMAPDTADHVVDQLIAERTTHLSQTFIWPVAKPLLYRYFHYRQAVAMADEVALELRAQRAERLRAHRGTVQRLQRAVAVHGALERRLLRRRRPAPAGRRARRTVCRTTAPSCGP